VTVGFHSPLPPARTGVADYSASLLPAFRKLCTVSVNSSSPCDIDLYHIGNNLLHREVYRRALSRPGIVVLHDAVLHHFYLGLGDRRQYLDEFAANYGGWCVGLAESLWRDRARSAQDPRYFSRPMLRRIVESARGIVVHNPGAAAAARAHGATGPIYEIPHLFVAPEAPPAMDVEHLRRRLGIPPTGFLFAVFGHLRESKRIVPVLRVFSGARRSHPEAFLLVAGECASSDLERAVDPLLRQPGVIRVPYLTEPGFWLHAYAAGACINLRYPSAGETSGITIRLMGIGKPVLLTAGLETSSFPRETCLRVDPGLAEEEMLSSMMLLLLNRPAIARRIGCLAAAHVRRHHSVDAAAALYHAACREVLR